MSTVWDTTDQPSLKHCDAVNSQSGVRSLRVAFYHLPGGSSRSSKEGTGQERLGEYCQRSRERQVWHLRLLFVYVLEASEGIFPARPPCYCAILWSLPLSSSPSCLRQTSKEKILAHCNKSCDRCMNTELWEQGEKTPNQMDRTDVGEGFWRRQEVTLDWVLQDLWKIKKAEEHCCKQKKNHEQKPRRS